MGNRIMQGTRIDGVNRLPIDVELTLCRLLRPTANFGPTGQEKIRHRLHREDTLDAWDALVIAATLYLEDHGVI